MNAFILHARNCPACERHPLGICPEGFKALGEASGMRPDGQQELKLELPRPEIPTGTDGRPKIPWLKK